MTGPNYRPVHFVVARYKIKSETSGSIQFPVLFQNI